MRHDLQIPTRPRSAALAPRRRLTGHTPWCGTRCRAGRAQLGEHRSDPIVAVAGPVGGTAVVGTRTAQQATGREHLELRINIPLLGATENQRATVADRAMRAITEAIATAVTSPDRQATTFTPNRTTSTGRELASRHDRRQPIGR